MTSPIKFNSHIPQASNYCLESIELDTNIVEMLTTKPIEYEVADEDMEAYLRYI